MKKAQSGPCRRAARLPMPWLLRARVELGTLLCSQAPLLARSGTEGEAGWRTALMSGVWAVLWKSEQGERGMEG